jgi:hypothetical protein
MRIPIDVQVAIDPENESVSIFLMDIPLDYLEGILLNLAEESWRQNIVDGIQGARAAKDLGILVTERSFHVRSEPID